MEAGSREGPLGRFGRPTETNPTVPASKQSSETLLLSRGTQDA